MKRFKKNNKGFSLVELIVVIAIMAILGVAVALAVTKFIPESRRSTDISNARLIAEAVEVAIGDGASFSGTVAHADLVATGKIKAVPKVEGAGDVKYNGTALSATDFVITYSETNGCSVTVAGYDLTKSDIATQYKSGTMTAAAAE